MADIILKHNAGFLGRNGKLLRSKINPCSLPIGANYGGGILAYLNTVGDIGYVAGECHGMIISPSDVVPPGSLSARWSMSKTNIGTLNFLRMGQYNTELIVANQGVGEYAAFACLNYSVNGYSDWYLPTHPDCMKIYENYILFGLDPVNVMWSSSQYDINNAWNVNSTGDGHADKFNSSRIVRAVRYF